MWGPWWRFLINDVMEAEGQSRVRSAPHSVRPSLVMAEAGVVDVAALVANAEADAACLEQAVTATVEQEAAAMEEMQQRAEEHGINQKSAGVHGWAGSMMRKF